MRKLNNGIMILMLGLSCLACHRENKTQIRIEEITPDRQQVAGHLIKEREVPIELGKYIFMPIRSDKSVYILDSLDNREVKLQRFDFELSRTSSRSFKEGQGPGEWQAPPEFVGYDDNILMIDRVVNRITWYDGQMNIVNTLRHNYNSPYRIVYSEVVKKAVGALGLYYFLPELITNKNCYYAGYNIQVRGGTIEPKKVSCKLYYETFQGYWKTRAEDVFESGEKILFTQTGDSLYIVDAETYTLTRMSLEGISIRSVQVKADRPEFSKETLQNWYKGFSGKMVDEHKGMWNPTFWYPSPLWPVAGIMPLGKGLAVITCKDYDPENRPDMLQADYFDLDMNYIGVIDLPAYPFWNCPDMDNTVRARGHLRWQMDRVFYLDDRDEEHPTLSRWRLE